MKTFMAVIFSILLGCSGGGEREALAADFIPMHVYLVARDAEITPDQVTVSWQYAEERFKQAGIPVHLSSFTVVDDIGFDDQRTADEQQLRLSMAQKWLNQHGGMLSWNFYYFIFPPILSGNLKLFGGMAYGGCRIGSGGLAIGQGGEWSSHTPPRERLSATGMVWAHEFDHPLGGTHKDAPPLGSYPINIMDSAAGRFIDTDPLWYLPDSIEEMLSCVGKTKSKKLKRCRLKSGGNKAKKKRCVKRVKRRAVTIPALTPVGGGDLLFE